MVEISKKNKDVTCFTAAMPSGTGLNTYAQIFPDRFIDVGIAEQNAVTMAAGMATMGLRPVVAVYSTFLQRAYDQLLHDVALQDLPVTFAIDRSGFVGHDGETHHGIYDLSYLLHMPNIHVYAPRNGDELRAMLYYSISEINHPVAIRYPRGKSHCLEDIIEDINQPEVLKTGTDGLVIAVGSMVDIALKASESLQEKGLSLTVVNPRRLKPLDFSNYENYLKEGQAVVTIEENAEIGGFGAYFNIGLQNYSNRIHHTIIGVGDTIIHHGSQEENLKDAALDLESLKTRLFKVFRGE